ncbi:MAG: protoporphyrinogen oxidase, partial [Clostridia bacterium]|nr:protoporphyrinogen oxidase [Clostridia bacterium]
PAPFVSFPDGLEELVRAVVAHLEARGEAELLTGRPVAAILAARGLGRPFAVRLVGGDALPADAVVVATPAGPAAELLRSLAPGAARDLAELRHVSTGTVTFAFRAAGRGLAFRGSGLVVPAVERRDLNALTVSSEKFPGRAPEGAVLVRAFFGGSRSPHLFDLPDDELVRRVEAEVTSLLGVAPPPLFRRLHRFPRAMAQYEVGHLERIARIEARLPRGVWLAGASYRGVGIPDCVREAEEAARAAVAHLAGETAAAEAGRRTKEASDR